MTLNSDGCNVDEAYLRNHEFHDKFARECWLPHVCYISAFDKFLRYMGDLFVFILPNDYLRIAKLGLIYRYFFQFWPCGQTAGWMKTPLGTEVDLGPGHIVLDGSQCV